MLWVSGRSPESSATGAKRPSGRNTRQGRRAAPVWHPALNVATRHAANWRQILRHSFGSRHAEFMTELIESHEAYNTRVTA